ncbi:MAG: hypothetical protein ACXAC7_13900 [Candidatus Hodarchaeales archaeon]|jgi:hypothetical protein
MFKDHKLPYKITIIYLIVCLAILPLIYVIFSFFFDNAAQIAIEIYMHLCFLGLLIFTGIKFGRWVYIYFIVIFIIVAYSEIQSVYVIRTYEYNNWITSQFFWEYPLTIVIGWIYLTYSSYLITNILFLGRENKDGFSDGNWYLPRENLFFQISFIIFLAFIDGLLLFHIGIVNETVGIDLGYWTYFESTVEEPAFIVGAVKAPTRTLFTYFAAGFIFNLVFRFSEFSLDKWKNIKTKSLNGLDSLPLYPFFLYWSFLLVQAIMKFGIDHWMIFVTSPVLVLLFTIVITRFFRLSKFFGTSGYPKTN